MAVLQLDPIGEIALTEGLGVGRELGIELAPGCLLGFEEGASRGHRGGEVVLVFALDADEVEEVALPARGLVRPGAPFGA